MLHRLDRSALVIRSRQHLASLGLLTLLAISTFAHANPSVTSSSANRSDTAFIDPNGLELDGAGAVESIVPFESTDRTLLAICVALAFGIIGTELVDQRRAIRPVKAPAGTSARPIRD
jgi:hypothetical protein